MTKMSTHSASCPTVTRHSLIFQEKQLQNVPSPVVNCTSLSELHKTVYVS